MRSDGVANSRRQATDVQSYVCFQKDCVAVVGETRVPGVPMGQYFCTRVQRVLTRASDTETRMRVTVEVVFTKKLMIKNMIVNGVKKGTKDVNNVTENPFFF